MKIASPTVLHFIALFIIATGCSTSSEVRTGQADPAQRDTTAAVATGTQEMAGLLARLEKGTGNPMQDQYANSERADFIATQIPIATDPGQRIQLIAAYGQELLSAGRTREAIATIDQLVAQMDQGAFQLNEEGRNGLLLLQGMCYMRLGEQVNCQNNHTRESCILPFTEEAQHQDPEGSTKAVEIFERTLREEPNELNARWLLNVANMTLGTYPEGVPRQWLIPEKAFASDMDIPRFHDVAMDVGVAVNGLSGGVCAGDLTGDGLLDIMCSSWALEDQVRFFVNAGDGSFVERTREAGLTGITGALNMVHADYDNDGDADVLMLRGAWLVPGDHPNSLLRNNGDGTFEDVTRSAGLLTFHPTQNATWGDMDNDGDLDLFIGNESQNGNEHPSELYRNNGNGTFTDVAAMAGLTVMGFVKGCAWGDVNNDGWMDLYVSDQRGPNRLYMNRGTGAQDVPLFEDKAKQAGVTLPINSFPTWFFDYDNDGWLDIFVASFPMRAHYGDAGALMAASYLGLPYEAETSHLYRNRGNGTFEDVTVKAGVNEPLFVMGSNYGDLNNDGFPDIYLGTGEPELRSIVPNRMYMNDGKGKFLDVTTSGGFGHLQKGHGVAFADFDNDGDQDIYSVMGGALESDRFTNVLFENPGMGAHWVKLDLLSEHGQRGAIGARIEVVVATPQGPRSIHALAGTGGSFGSDPLRVEIGLGNATTITSITIKWPGSNTTQLFTDVPMDKLLRLQEGQQTATVVPLPVLNLAKKATHDGHHHHGM